MRTRTSLTTIAAVAAALAAGCGDDETRSGTAPELAAARDTVPATTAAEEPVAKKPARRTGRVVKVVDSQFGRVLADAKGEAFYLFDAEERPRAECYGACAEAWPPVLTKGAPRAGAGARQSKLGRTRRRDGSMQVTYAGHPLYYYVQDTPGNILCQNVDEFGGLWLVVKPSGEPVV